MSNIFKRTKFSPQLTRRALFAGSWYEADAKKLRAQIDDFLKSANDTLKEKPYDETFAGNKLSSEAILAGIVPHAGYAFSGPTAGFVYAALAKRKINRVFLLGPSHYVTIHGCALPVDTSFKTPLGDLKLDTRVIKELSSHPLFQFAPVLHQNEHSLELQLPFIKKVFGKVHIVPIVVGTLNSEQEIRLVGSLIKQYLTDGDIILVSSDFTHYGPRYNFVPFLDQTAKRVRELDQAAFEHLQKCDLKGLLIFETRLAILYVVFILALSCYRSYHMKPMLPCCVIKHQKI